jgi:hypothetical protein
MLSTRLPKAAHAQGVEPGVRISILESSVAWGPSVSRSGVALYGRGCGYPRRQIPNSTLTVSELFKPSFTRAPHQTHNEHCADLKNHRHVARPCPFLLGRGTDDPPLRLVVERAMPGRSSPSSLAAQPGFADLAQLIV